MSKKLSGVFVAIVVMMVAIGCRKEKPVYAHIADGWLQQGTDFCWVGFGATIEVSTKVSPNLKHRGRVVAVGDVDVRHETRSCPVGTTFTISAGELGKRVSKQHEEELGREERYQKLLARTATMSITTNSVPATEFSNAVLRRRIGRCGWVEVASPEKKRTCYLKPGAKAVLVADGEIEQLYYYLSPRVDPALSTCYPGEEFFLPKR